MMFVAKVVVHYLYGDWKTWHRGTCAEFDATLKCGGAALPSAT